MHEKKQGGQARYRKVKKGECEQNDQERVEEGLTESFVVVLCYSLTKGKERLETS